MSARKVASVETTSMDDLSLTRVGAVDDDARLVVVSARRLRGIQHAFAVGQPLRPALISFARAEDGKGRRCSTVGGHAEEARAATAVRRKHDGAVRVPGSAAACGCVAHRDRRAAGYRTLLQFAAREESNPSAVW